MKKIFLSFLICAIANLSSFGQMADFTLPGTDGNDHNLHQYLSEGNVVVMEFFFVGCGICAGFAPTLQEIYVDNGSNADNVKIFTVNMAENTMESIESWDETHGLTMPALYGDNADDFFRDNIQTITNSGGAPQVVVLKPNTENPGESEITFINAGGLSSDKIEELKNAIEDSKIEEVNSSFEDLDKIQISVFPNPSKDHLNIQLEEAGTYVLSVFDLNGKLSKQERLNNVQNKVQLNDLEAGTYFIQITENGQTVHAQRFQKQ